MMARLIRPLLGLVLAVPLFLASAQQPSCEGPASQESAEQLVRSGDEALRDRQPATAKDYYDRALTIDSNYVPAYLGRAAAYHDLGEWLKSVEDLDRALRIKPTAAAYYRRAHTFAAHLNSLQQAVNDVTKAIELMPRNADFYHWRGHYYHDLKLYRPAIEDFTRALQVRPDFSACYIDRAHAHWHFQEYREGLADSNEAIRLNPKNTHAYFERGQAYFGLKNYSSAIDSYTQALQIDAKYLVAYRRRGEARQAMGDTEGGRADTEAAASIGSEVSSEPPSAHGTAAGATIGSTLEDFSVRDLGGRQIRLSDFRGKVVLVNFWATWCGPCMAELPNLLRAYQRYHTAGFEIIGISLDKDLDRLRQVVRDRRIEWPQHADGHAWDNELARRSGVHAIPATYLLDPSGRVVRRNLRGAELEKAVASLLGSPEATRPADRPEAQPQAEPQTKPEVKPSDQPARAGQAGVTTPQLIHRVEPEYTETARRDGLEGTVVLYTVVETDGMIRQARVTRSLRADLDQKAMEAVKQWQFRPGTKEGKPVRVVAAIEVTFRLL
jgi:TonB family protein